VLTPSHALAGLVLGLCALCAWAVWHFGRRAGEPEGKVRALTLGFALAGVAGGWFTYHVDSRQRRTTLFEAVAAVAPTESGVSVHHLVVEVEHPGVEHTLLVAPIPGRTTSAEGPRQVGVRWTEPGGAIAVEGVQRALPRARSHRAVRSVWSDVSWRFTPRRAGRHAVLVEVECDRVERLLVRVEDPLKRDGVRAPGY